MNPIIAVAERSLRAWADDLSRESAARLLDMWSHADELSADDRVEVLSRFVPAEPVMMAGVDYLPEPPVEPSKQWPNHQQILDNHRVLNTADSPDEPFLPIAAGLALHDDAVVA